MKSKFIFEGISEKGNKFLIRYPGINDVVKINNYINNLSAEKTFVRYQKKQYSLEEEKEYLEDSLRRISGNQSVQLLVFSDNKIVGISSVELSDGAQAHEGTLGISMLKEYRNEGIGKKLFESILKEAEKNLTSLIIITLSVFGNNTVAINFYKKYGFKEYGRLPKGIFYKNKYLDNIYMFKNIKN